MLLCSACWCDCIGRYEGFEVGVELEGVISEEITGQWFSNTKGSKKCMDILQELA